MNENDYCLIAMIVSYAYVISLTIYYYILNPSISSIVCDEQCNNNIVCGMTLMGIFTILYEWKRDDMKSFSCILFVLAGIIGVLYTNKDDISHTISAFIVFIAITLFMIHHTIKNYPSICLCSILILFSILLFIILYQMYNEINIFFVESLLLFLFAVFYLYIHFIQESKPTPTITH